MADIGRWAESKSLWKRLPGLPMFSEERYALVLEALEFQVAQFLNLVDSMETLAAYFDGPLVFLQTTALTRMFGLLPWYVIDMDADRKVKADAVRDIIARYQVRAFEKVAKINTGNSSTDEPNTTTQAETATKPDAECKTERTGLIAAYKREGRRLGITITDELIAKAASTNWNDRTQVTWWKSCDKRSTAVADRLIRKVLRDKPHIPQVT